MADAVTTITIGGETIALPGAYSTLDTTEAQVPGFGTGKVLAIVADTVGGEPQKLQSYTSLSAVRQDYLFSGLATNLKYNAALMARLAYNASDDDRINGTFDRIVFVKPARDEAAVGELQGTGGVLADLTAKDWGAHTNQFGYQIGLGTSGGVSVQIIGGSVITQSGDNVGADPVLQVRYDGQAEAMKVYIDPDVPEFYMNFEESEDGLEGTEIVAGWTSGVASVVSTDTGDKADVTVYGLDSGNNPVAEAVTLNGTSPQATTQVFAKVTGVRVHGMTIGTVTVDDSIPLSVATFAPTVAVITTPPDNIQVKSSSPSDTGYSVQLTGKDVAGGDVAETVVLNGTSVVQTANKFSLLLTVKVVGTTAGTITVQDTVPSTLVSLAPGTDPSAGLDNTKGLFVFDPPMESKELLQYQQTGGPNDFVVRGRNLSGISVAEHLDLASGSTVSSFSSLEHIELGAVPNATGNVGVAGKWFGAADVTMDDLETAIELQNGAIVTSLNGDRKVSEMDKYVAIDTKGATQSFYSQAQDVIDFFNSGVVIGAVRRAGATGLPVITGSTILLTGGLTATATNSDIQAALDALKTDKDIRVIVPGYTDQATHLLMKGHVNDRALPSSRAECRSWVPLDPTTATKQAIKDLTVALNNERIKAVVQRQSYYDDDGILQVGDSLSFALTMAGMQSAATVGEPLTHKFMSAVGVTQDGAWNPEQDGDELVRSGLVMSEEVKGRGYRVIRSVTTYQKRKDRIRTETSAMESADESARDLRNFMEEQLTGAKNLLVTDDSIKNMVEGRLGDQDSGQIGEGIITAWRNVTVTITGDLIIVDYEVAPVEPINFIQLQAHVFTVVQQTAA
jgi:hypothetical protein